MLFLRYHKVDLFIPNFFLSFGFIERIFSLINKSSSLLIFTCGITNSILFFIKVYCHFCDPWIQLVWKYNDQSTIFFHIVACPTVALFVLRKTVRFFIVIKIMTEKVVPLKR